MCKSVLNQERKLTGVGASHERDGMMKYIRPEHHIHMDVRVGKKSDKGERNVAEYCIIAITIAND